MIPNNSVIIIMKRLFCYLLSALLFVGCVTNPDTGKKELSDAYVKKVANAVELASFNGSYLYLKDHPEQKTLFIDISKDLDVLIQEDLTLNGFLMVIRHLPIKELKNDKTILIVDNVIILFGMFQDDLIKLDKLEQVKKLKPIVIAVRSGINKAILKD